MQKSIKKLEVWTLFESRLVTTLNRVDINPERMVQCVYQVFHFVLYCFNPLNAELNPMRHLLALLEAHHILHISGVRVKSHPPFAGIIRRSPYSPL
jgi:hypothetical protein